MHAPLSREICLGEKLYGGEAQQMNGPHCGGILERAVACSNSSGLHQNLLRWAFRR
jgi:hypothetical protein